MASACMYTNGCKLLLVVGFDLLDWDVIKVAHVALVAHVAHNVARCCAAQHSVLLYSIYFGSLSIEGN